MSHVFYRSIVKQVISGPRTLCVTSPGLGVSEILKLLLKEYCSAHYLALVVGVPSALTDSIIEYLADEKLPPCELVAGSESSKKKVYNRGGVILVGARVLAGDLLRATIKPHLVSAMFLWDVHKLCATEYYPACLALRVTMEANDSVVIRCFSDDPERVDRLRLQPLVQATLCSNVVTVLRAQPEVSEALREPETIIVEPSMTSNLVKIVRLMDELICALARKLGFQVSLGDAFTRDWLALWRSDPSRQSRGKPLGSFLDLQDLVRLAPTVEDAVPGNFLASLNSVISTCRLAQRGDWLLTRSGDELVGAARARCEAGERPAKWGLLCAILAEVQRGVRVLVIVRECVRRWELRAMLAGHAEDILRDSRAAAMQGAVGDGSTFVHRRALAEHQTFRGVHAEEMTGAREFSLGERHEEFQLQVEVEAWPLDEQELMGAQLLERHKARVLVVYDHPGTTFTSVLESWKGASAARIYSLGHMEGPQVMRTRRAFQRLDAAERSLLQQHRSLHSVEAQVSRPRSPFEGHRERPRVIVDAREINETCQLPAKLWREGWDVVPLMLGVGDYIVRDIVVERKTASDLVSSLADGRLVKQCEQMQRLYARQAIMLQCHSYQLDEVLPHSSARCNYAKFALLAKNFPRLSVLWASSVTDMSFMLRTLYSSSTAELDMSRAASSATEGLRGGQLRDLTPELFLARVPGVVAAQVARLMHEGGTLGDLVRWPQKTWTRVLGAKNGKRAHAFFNTETQFDEEEDSPKLTRKKSSFKRRRRRQ